MIGGEGGTETWMIGGVVIEDEDEEGLAGTK
jgi:hypothetical protein